MNSPVLGKRKPTFVIVLIIINGNIERLEKVIETFLRNYFTFTIVLMAIAPLNTGIFVIFEQCETHTQLKERETFWQHELKSFYPIGLNEKEEYLY